MPWRQQLRLNAELCWRDSLRACYRNGGVGSRRGDGEKRGAMDALRRSKISFDTAALQAFYAGKTVLVTGAAGSIGSALSEQLATMDCRRLVMLDQFDHGLLEIVERVSRIDRRLDAVDALCDIRDPERLTACFSRVKPDIVIHAAALKHVHLGERHPAECVLTNLVGVRNTLEASATSGAGHFTLVSSDKAASPVCVMGATKRLAELHLATFARERAPSMAVKSVRFGNVVGSQGSVLPRFSAQIAAGGPLEVTHPEMERFFMSVQDAVGLILTVTSEAESGVYFMEMGEAVSILELGREMIERSGRKISIQYTGLRPGEKLKEELFDAFESVSEAGLPGVFRVTPHSASGQVSTADVEQMKKLARQSDDSIIRQRVFAFLDARLGREESAVG